VSTLPLRTSSVFSSYSSKDKLHLSGGHIPSSSSPLTRIRAISPPIPHSPRFQPPVGMWDHTDAVVELLQYPVCFVIILRFFIIFLFLVLYLYLYFNLYFNFIYIYIFILF
jgi:hypothetical protein